MIMDVFAPWTVAALAVAALLWLAYRKGRVLSGRRYAVGSFLPSSPPSAGRTARIVETTVLLASATIIIAISATWQSTGGLMLMLDELQPQYATVNVIMFVCAVAGAAVAVLITCLGRTAVGTITMAVVLIGYGLILNGGSYPGSPFISRHSHGDQAHVDWVRTARATILVDTRTGNSAGSGKKNVLRPRSPCRPVGRGRRRQWLRRWRRSTDLSGQQPLRRHLSPEAETPRHPAE
jgi:hypothetical protein